MLDDTTGSLQLAVPPQYIPKYEGYRLARMDVANFGGYHGAPQSILFGLDGTLLTGANGAGKSTILDAFSLLFATNPPLNVAASKGKSRNLESYVLGKFSMDEDENATGQMRARDEKKLFTIISAQFRNGNGEYLTVVRLIRSRQSTSPESLYVVADEAVDVPLHFAQWRTPASLIDYAEMMSWSGFSVFNDYIACVADRFGFDDADSCKSAFRLLVQSMKTETANSVADFVREHILPDGDLEEQMKSAFDGIRNARQQVDLIERTEHKINALDTLRGQFEKLENTFGRDTSRSLLRSRINQYQSEAYRHMASVRLGQHREKLEKRQEAAAQLEDRLATVKSELATVKDQIAANDGDLIETLEANKRALENVVQAADRRLAEIAAKFERLEVEFSADTEVDWAESFSALERFQSDLRHDDDDLSTKLQDASDRVRDCAARLTAEKERLQSLKENRTALDGKYLRARATMAAELGVDTETLQFFGEVVQIRDGEEVWEGAANRVLNSAAHRILVPETLYREALRALNRRHWGIRVQLHEVKASASPRPVDNGALAGKLEIHPDYAYPAAAEEILNSSAFHICVSEDEFASGTFGACVTAAGSISRRSGQAEKDDRRSVDDRSRYVLGWSVETQIALAEEAVAGLEKEHSAEQAHYATIGREKKQLSDKLRNVDNLLEYDGAYDEIENKESRAELDSLLRKLAAIDTSKLDEMKARRSDLEGQQSDLEAKNRKATMEVGNAQGTVGSLEEELETHKAQIADSVEAQGELSPEQTTALNEIVAEAAPELDGSLHEAISNNPTIDLGNVFLRVQACLETKRESDQRALSKVVKAIGDGSSSFLDTYEEEYEHLGTEGLTDKGQEGELRRAEWIRRFERLSEDARPEHRSKAEAFLQDTIVQVPMLLNNQISKHERDVNERRDAINRMLKGKTFDPAANTRAELVVRKERDSDFKEFDRVLAELGQLAQHQGTADIETLKSQADRLSKMMVESDSDTGLDRTLRQKLFNLNNRFTATLHEFIPDEDGSPKQTVNKVSTSADKLSGGQQERLTNLLTAAAISSAFGGHDEARRERALLMVILDEAFKNSGLDTLEASADIFQAMGLQIITAGAPERMILGTDYVSQSVFVNMNRERQSFAMSRPLSENGSPA